MKPLNIPEQEKNQFIAYAENHYATEVAKKFGLTVAQVNYRCRKWDVKIEKVYTDKRKIKFLKAVKNKTVDQIAAEYGLHREAVQSRLKRWPRQMQESHKTFVNDRKQNYDIHAKATEICKEKGYKNGITEFINIHGARAYKQQILSSIKN